MEDKQVLIKWSGNWADEMYLKGFYLTTARTADEIWERLPTVTESFSEYFGSNQEIEWINGKDLLSELERVELTKEEAEVVYKLFSSNYGKFPDSVFDAGWEEDV